MSELAQLIEALEQLSELSGKRYPFKRASHLGKGPKNQHHDQADQWECPHCKNFKCTCIGIGKNNEGQVKHIKDRKARKDAYNKEYKAGKYPHWDNRSSRYKGKQK